MTSLRIPWEDPDYLAIAPAAVFDGMLGSRTRLAMWMVHWGKPLALASPSRVFALTRATVSRSQADPVLFLLTKRV